MNAYTIEPDNPEGYALDLGGSFWSICVPEASVNLIVDPAFQTQGGNFDATIKQLFTAKSSGWHTFSAYVRLHTGVSTACVIGFQSAFDVMLGSTIAKLRHTADWQRITFSASLIAGQNYKAVLQNQTVSTLLTTCWWQVEAKPYTTTYFDGSMAVDFPAAERAYWWHGTPFASPSQRSERTRTGGRLVSLADYGFRTLSVVGLGGLPIEPKFDLAYSGRFSARALAYRQREFIIGGIIYADTFAKLNQLRKTFTALFAPTVNGKLEPIHLLVNLEDSELHLYAYYVEGVEGELTSRHQQKFALRFLTAEQPYFCGNYNTIVATKPGVDTDFMVAVHDDDSGEWTNYATSTGGIHTYYALDHDSDGNVYICGDMPGYVHRLFPADGLTGNTAIGSGLNCSKVTALAVAKDGSDYIVAVGNMGEIHSDTPRSARVWNGNVWSLLGAGIEASVINAACWYGNSFYIGGQIDLVHDANGAVHTFYNCVRYAYVTKTWHELGLGFGVNDAIYALVAGMDGLIYITGNLTLLTETGNYVETKIAVYDPNTDVLAPYYPIYAKRSIYAPYPVTPAFPYDLTFDDTGQLHMIGEGVADPVNPAHGVSAYSLLTPRGSEWRTDELFGAPYAFTNHITLAGAPVGAYCSGRVLGFNNTYWGDLPDNQLIYRFWGHNTPLTTIDLLSLGRANTITDARTPIHRIGTLTFIASDQWGYGKPSYGVPHVLNYAGTAETQLQLLLIGPVTLWSLWNWTQQTQLILAEPLTIQSGQIVIVYARNGALWSRNVSNQNSTAVPLSVHLAATDLATLTLYPGVNRITVMHTGGTVLLRWLDTFMTL